MDLYASSIDVGPVKATLVLYGVAVWCDVDTGVASRNGNVVQEQVTARMPPDGHRLALEAEEFAFSIERITDLQHSALSGQMLCRSFVGSNSSPDRLAYGWVLLLPRYDKVRTATAAVV
jgi:hypothetical protein